MDMVRHYRWIRENSRANDAAHDKHHGIEESKLTARLNRCCHSEPFDLAQGKLCRGIPKSCLVIPSEVEESLDSSRGSLGMAQQRTKGATFHLATEPGYKF